MKKPILYLLILLSTNFLSAQGTLTFSPSVPSVTNGLVDFTFDLVGGGAGYDLLVEVSFDNGTNWDVIPAADIAGQLSNVAPGNISLQWDATASFTGQVTNDAVLSVTARHVCGTDFTFDYNGTQVTYGTVLIDYGGSVGEKCWMDRNLGASEVPTVLDDADGYGDLFQWGRGTDGHQVRDPLSGTTGTQITDPNSPHDDFVIGHPNWYNGTSPDPDDLWQEDGTGINNPCPDGWRVPTRNELTEEQSSWDPGNIVGAFDSALKWPAGGRRSSTSSSGGSIIGEDTGGYVWSSTVTGTADGAWNLFYLSTNDGWSGNARANGYSVRCIRNIE